MTSILVSLFLGLLFLGVPIAISISGASWFVIFLENKIPTIVVAQNLLNGLNKFTLIAVIFFILAGNVMTKGGVSEKLVALADKVVGKFTGGLAMVTTLSAMFFGAISGSSSATTAAIGSIMVPNLKKAGYDKEFSAAVVAASGLLGLIIPPSGTMLLYSIIANVSVLRMFISGIVPGIIMTLSIMTIEYFVARKNNFGKHESFEFQTSDSDSQVKILFESFMALMTPIIILGGIYGGIFTPSEAAGVAVFYGILVGYFVLKQLTFEKIFNAFLESGIVASVIMFLIGAASVFGWLLAMQQIPVKFTQFIMGFTTSPNVVLFLANIGLLIAGSFLNNPAAISLLTPVLVPLVTSFGIDPTFFGVIMIINLAIGQITPPIGMNLFVSSNVSGVSFEKIVVQIIPFLLVLLANLMLFTYVPEIVTFLPDLLL